MLIIIFLLGGLLDPTAMVKNNDPYSRGRSSEMVHRRAAATVFDHGERANDPKKVRELGPDIGKRLRIAREASGLTVRELAHRAHTSKTTVLAISEGRGGNSGLGVMVRLAKALGVRPCWLCFGEGSGPG